MLQRKRTVVYPDGYGAVTREVTRASDGVRLLLSVFGHKKYFLICSCGFGT